MAILAGDKSAMDGDGAPQPRISGSAPAFDSNQLGTSGGATLERNRRLAATEVTCYKREQFFVRLAVDRRRLELGKPNAILSLRQDADARVRLDLDRDDGDLRFFEHAHVAERIRRSPARYHREAKQ